MSEATNSLEKVTVIIPEHNRPRCIIRLLDYYEKDKVNVLVCDSSTEKFVYTGRNENVHIIHYPGLSYFDKMSQCLQHITTDYVVLCDDDDLVVPSSMVSCINFLEENRDYASAQGLTINFEYYEAIESYPYNLAHEEIDVNSDNSLGRIRQLYSSYRLPLYSAVNRLSGVKSAFATTPKDFVAETLILAEHTMNIAPLIEGKHKVLPVFYQAREFYRAKGGARNLFSVVTSKRLSPIYHSLVHNLSILLAGKENLEVEEVKKELVLIVDRYLGLNKEDDNLTEGSTPSEFVSTIRKFVNYLPFVKQLKQYYSDRVWASRAIRARKDLIASKVLTRDIEGYPYYTKDAKSEWDKIQEFIIKHPQSHEIY